MSTSYIGRKWNTWFFKIFSENPIFHDVGQYFYTILFFLHIFSTFFLKINGKTLKINGKALKINEKTWFIGGNLNIRIYIVFVFCLYMKYSFKGANNVCFCPHSEHRRKRRFLYLSKKWVFTKISNHTCCMKKKICGKFKYLPRLLCHKKILFKK